MIDIRTKEFFLNFLLEWYKLNKRDFPWRYTFNPYLVLVSEILLQQTNACKVVDPYEEITSKYFDIEKLADADILFLRDIFSELGLFYRADRMISIAGEIKDRYKGIIPNIRDQLIKIKGIGDYSCNAILCFGYNQQYAIVDTNIIRIFQRIFGFKSEKKRPRTDKKIWEFAEYLLPPNDYIDYNYALLDFGALICTAKQPKCSECKIRNICLDALL